ncbi:MAG: phosphate ABC transporter substrate-binding protein [Opitutales bacterium]|nr:phosphate ABC transporter substrate-binding protein [Opitutales bacterium]
MYKKITSLALASMVSASSLFGNVEVDPNLPTYERVSGISGNLNSIGSDTLNNLLLLWAEGFREIYPNVNIQIEGAGSSTAPAALIEGTAQIGPMSRAMRGTEIENFEAAYGYAPTQVNVAIDGIAVYAHRENPVEGLTLQEVDGIFSSTNRLGGSTINNWSEVRGSGDSSNMPITPYGRNSASGTYAFFRNVALGGGDYRSEVAEQPGSSAVVQSVGADRGGIGYSGVGYKTSGVRFVPLSTDGENFYYPTAENCVTGNYPIARFLILYVNRNPREEMDSLTYEFLRFALSKQGQEIVARDGFFPLPASTANQILESLK